MPADVAAVSLPARGSYWKWGICGLLLLATMLNYMDRLTLNLTIRDVMEEFQFDERRYGYLESAFAFAFALGAICFGWMADRYNVRWVYPVAVLCWSAAGFATGLVTGFVALLACRFLLGMAEAGNWPNALRTTQRILAPSERTMGNSILQSGAAFGAILTPLIVMGLADATGTWRWPFLVIGVLGLVWVVLWLACVRGEDLALQEPMKSSSLVSILGVLVVLLGLDLAVHFFAPENALLCVGTKVMVTILGIGFVCRWLVNTTTDDNHLPRPLFIRRFLVLMVLVTAINATWHFFRAWLPLFLETSHGYSKKETGWFILSYYVVTDLGTLTAGFVTLLLARGGLPVHASRLTVFIACAGLTTLSIVVGMLPAGPLLLGLLLIVGFGALGLFPNYYSFSQEITVRYQGKVTGALGCICWLGMSLLHELVGDSIKRTGSYSLALAVAGLLPLVGVAALVLFWGKSEPPAVLPEPAPATPESESAPDEPVQTAIAAS